MTTTAATHWHVKRHDEDDDVFAGDLAESLDYAAGEMDDMAEHEHGGVSACGDEGDFEEAYRCFQRSETYSNLTENLRSIHRQHTAPLAERAPIYQGDDEKTRAALAKHLVHVLGMANSNGPAGFAIYECGDVECAPSEGDD